MERGILSGRNLGKYELRHLLSRGAMGDVYLAYQSDLEREVAVKILRDNGDANYRERFLREAKISASLEHPHIVPVYDYGIEDSHHVLVMRLMTGGTLEDRLSTNQLALDSIDRLLKQLADALDYAHRRRVVHRDIKPSNTLFDEKETAYLGDFGIAKLMHGVSGLTTGGKLWGTPPFMAPELWKDEDASPATDIYALGILIYRALTGKMPFEADSSYGFMMQHLYSNLIPLQTFRPGLPQPVQSVLETAMAKDAHHRFTTAGDFSRAFTQSITLPLPLPPAPPAILPKTERRSRPRRGIALVIASVAFILAVIIILLKNVPSSTTRVSRQRGIVLLIVSVPLILAVIFSLSILRPSLTPTGSPSLESPVPTYWIQVPTTASITPSLTATASPPPTEPVTPPVVPNLPVTPILHGEPGELTNQRRSVPFDYHWQSGEVYSICARSRTFIVNLSVEGPDGRVISNENATGDTCILDFVVATDGIHTVIVSSADGTSNGNFNLEIISYSDCPGSIPFGRVTGINAVPVRSIPATFGNEPIGVALPNECFAIIGQNEDRDWWRIHTDDGRTGGWIPAVVVETIGDTTNVPIESR